MDLIFKKIIRIGMILLTLGVFSGLSWGQTPPVSDPDSEGFINKLFGPGPLMSGHRDLEHGDCLKCHDAGKGVPDSKCLDCHKPIRDSINSKSSFHALTSKPCIACHSDHKGRDYDSTFVNIKNFNHSQTGFALNGSHANLNCKKCHTQTRTGKSINPQGTRFFGLQASCTGCHKKDDPHQFQGSLAQRECSSCHTEVAWKPASTFNHAKETGFALVGRHAKLKCVDCHKKQANGTIKYRFPEFKNQKCLTCHKDHHQDKLSSKFRNGQCETCHNQDKWSITQFNHSVTGFELKGSHSNLNCLKCHEPGTTSNNKLGHTKFAGLNKQCVTCHADYHGFEQQQSKRFGLLKNCESCHSEINWKHALFFNHNVDTRYPLTGKHIGLKCFECHKVKPGHSEKEAVPRHYHFQDLDRKTCETCHANPHTKSPVPAFKQPCASCHSTASWKTIRTNRGGFDHSTMTRFPLTGDHKNLACDSCHKVGEKEVYKFPFADKGFCESCHASVHKKQFSPKFVNASCGTCHDTVDFKNITAFNHDLTRFKLTGRHQNISQKCSQCHTPTKLKLPTKPPKAAGKFRFQSEKNGFCSECHTNVHQKQFSPKFANLPCKDCHTTHDFKKIMSFDHSKTAFEITGSHQKIKNNCQECHVKTKDFLPTKPKVPAGKFQFADKENGFCTSCHENVHKGQFSQKFSRKPCRDCHNTQAFHTGIDFNHRQSRFDLLGKHRQLKCFECHTKTKNKYHIPPHNFKGKFLFPQLTEQSCATCHKDVHKGKMGKNCSVCHNEKSWNNISDFHRFFELSGIHYHLDCKDCHFEQRILSGVRDDCLTCHQKDDVHNGAYPECGACHTQNFWASTSFNHSFTNFPLRGMHRLAPCESCHAGAVYDGLPTDCQTCHFNDAQQVTFPNHSLPEFQNCQSCHSEFSFMGKTRP